MAEPLMVVELPAILLDRGSMCRAWRGFNRVGFLLSICALDFHAQSHSLVIRLFGVARG